MTIRKIGNDDNYIGIWNGGKIFLGGICMKSTVKMCFFIILMAVMAISACAQQYDSESDFKATPRDGGKAVEITGYTGTKWEIRIPQSIQGLPVTHISRGAFRENKNITRVTIPNSVTTIGKEAFNDCPNLANVTIGNSVTTIGERAFSGCTGLTGVIIPNSVTIIEEGAFNWCTSLANVTIGNSVTSIGANAFIGCKNLTNVTFQGTLPMRGFGGHYFSPGSIYSEYGPAFLGDLHIKFFATNKDNGTPGTYTTTAPVSEKSVWTKQ